MHARATKVTPSKNEYIDIKTNMSTRQAAIVLNTNHKTIGNYKITTMTTSRSMSTLYAQKISKIQLKNLVPAASVSDAADNKKLVAIKRHFPASTSEWNNSVYAYNSKRTILLSAIDKIVIKLIKSYFNAYFLSSRAATSPPLRGETKISKLSRIHVSKLELKHTSFSVVITVFVYCDELKNLESLYKKLRGGTKDSFVGLLAKNYNKKVQLRVVRLRSPELNASVLAQHLATELNQRTSSPLRLLRIALKTVRIPIVDLKLYYLKRTSLLRKKYSELYNSISTLSVGDLKKINKTLVRNDIIANTRYKAITGVKIQIAGRLTRRATAAKGIVKTGQTGGLRNIDSSVLGLPVGLLRGHQKPNVQKSYYNSTTKNGAFNVRV
jgi:hypothetical protein